MLLVLACTTIQTFLLTVHPHCPPSPSPHTQHSPRRSTVLSHCPSPSPHTQHSPRRSTAHPHYPSPSPHTQHSPRRSTAHPHCPSPPHTTLTKKKQRAPSSNDTKKPVIRCFADYVYKVETTWVNSEKVRNLNFYERSILISREIYFRWQCYTIVLWLCMHVWIHSNYWT